MLNLGELIFSRFAASIPQVNIIPEFRQIRAPVAGETTEYGLSGKSLIELLASYQHPEDGRDHERVKFDHIEKFVRKLLHLPEATLEVTHSKDKIMLTNNGLRLPLASYGTGVHELVILVTAVLSIENAICCIEEPEIHLHPRLQREFIDFISSETANQYLISTHSPTFINALNSNDNLQVFHLQLENGATIGGPISKDSESLTALHDLGMKASDILQSNCILWVEGPSDRIYLKRWIELLAPGLVEGRDYSVMFYGGRLLSHISADREKVPDEFLHILAINQNAVVVMDSDCKQEGDNINETKRRVKEECERNGDICWVTEGREVENYLSERVVKAVCGELCGKQVEISIEPYAKLEQEIGDSLAAAGATNFDYSKDKIKYARLFAQQYKVDDLVSPLRERVEEIVARIKFWNE